MLAEREPQITRIMHAIAEAAGNRGSLLLLTGPSGTGTTSLLQVARDLATSQGAAVLSAVAATAERDFPFGVLRQLYEPLIAGLTDTDRTAVMDGVADFVRPVFAADGCSADAESLAPVPHAVLHGTRHLLSVVGRHRPVVLLVDDLQWADVESLRCLGYVAHRLAGLSVVIVASLRPGLPESESELVRAVADGAAEVLRTGPLSDEGVRTTIRLVCGADATERFTAAAVAASRGTPLVLRTLLSDLAQSGLRPDDAGAENLLSARPRALRSWYAFLLRSLPAQALSYAAALSFLGDAADARLVGEIAGLDHVECGIITRNLQALGLIVPDRTPRFSHPAAHDAVRDTTGVAEAERLHIAAARALHRMGHPAEQVAAHLLAVPSPQGVWAVDALRDAVRAAARRGASSDAARYLRRALLDTPAHAERRGTLLVELAAVVSATDPEVASRHLLQALPLLPDGAGRAEALVEVPVVCWRAAPEEVTDAARSLLADAGGVDLEHRMRVEARLVLLAEDRRAVGDATRRLAGEDRARLLATPGGRELLAALLRAAALGAGMSCADVVAAASDLLAAVSPEDPGIADTVAALVETFVLADRPDAVATVLDMAAHEVRRRADPIAIATLEDATVLALLAQGLVGVSLELMSEQASCRPVAASALLVGAILTLPDLDRARWLLADPVGSEHPVITAFRQALRAIEESPDSLATRVQRLLDCGRCLDRVGWSNPAVFPWRSHAAELLHRLGDHAAALELVRAELAAAVRWGGRQAIGRAQRAVGVAEPGAAGVHATREALDTVSRSGNRWELARTEAQLSFLLRDSDPDESARLAARARATAEACGVRLQGLHDAPVPLKRPRDGLPRPSGLTPAELRVAGLAAAGLTNQMIAEELDVSSRAVEKHLTNVYRKLGVSGRTALRDALGTRFEPDS
ncbi:AAA family ATPase [Lentzea sp. HUAS12]|uniref:AAA family ATPase n=1 Tax=Lentzea sp. HUAS12 TaxID=2951806 RepID=UPI00209D8694|nr:LuxR family transcriptional regulator [Lentzea sp. HUAS12]USX54028.1 AAA family ATPase [Lentzea sp. HUAS12]